MTAYRSNWTEAVAALKASQERKQNMAGETNQGAISPKVIGTIGQVNVLLATAITGLGAYLQARQLWKQQNPNTPDPFPPDQELINLFSQEVGTFDTKAQALLAKYADSPAPDVDAG